MTPKKNPKSDLENKRVLFLQIGFIMALSFTLIAFEWSKPDIKVASGHHSQLIDVPIEIIPITRPSPPEPPKLPKPANLLVITQEIIELDDPIEIPSTEGLDPIYLNIDYGDATEERDEIHFWTEKMPEFPGGNKALMRYLASALKFPDEALRSRIDGTVYIRFVVDKKGKVSNIEVQRSLHPALDAEAVRVIASMPDWTPGEQNMKPVNVYYTVPISFRIY
jgi:periplasmic protein TonB